MDLRDFQSIMDDYKEFLLESFMEGDDFDPGIQITYPASTGILIFPKTYLAY